MECPYCNGEVSESARKCKNCGEWIKEPPAGSAVPAGASEKEGSTDRFKVGVIVLLILGLIGAVLYVGLTRRKSPPPASLSPLLLCPVHSVPITPSHRGPCTYQHGVLVFNNELHEGNATVTIETGHEQGKFCDHSHAEVVKTLHHAEIEVIRDVAVGKVHFRVKSDEGETYRGHVTLRPREQVKCGVKRGPQGLTCDITMDEHGEEGHHK